MAAGDTFQKGLKTNTAVVKPVGGRGRSFGASARYGQKFKTGKSKDGKIVHMYANGKRVVVNKKSVLKAVAGRKNGGTQYNPPVKGGFDSSA